ncbi:MAG: hypothetical protein OK404_00310 [Thaumarchaeota archaeon]|nr:hypothetical protein [Nitrososphaerota archaeon]
MAPDPQSTFGNLLRGCISERYLPKDKGAAEGALMVTLGLCTSVATTYLLSVVGVLL